MSLINDALKKAQRQRAEPAAAGDAAGGTAGGRVQKRGQPMRAQTLILLVAGAAVLVVFSVVVTVYLLNRPAPPSHATLAPAKPVKIAPAVDSPSPVVVLPVTTPPPAAAKPAASANEAAAAPPGAVEASPKTAMADTPAPIAPTPSAPAETKTAPPAADAAAAKAESVAAHRPAAASSPIPDVRVQMFVDTIRVTGIRSSGTDSKVLMNDRVYRVNDIVDRTLGLKLVKVEADKLSFSDPSGVIYTKTF